MILEQLRQGIAFKASYDVKKIHQNTPPRRLPSSGILYSSLAIVNGLALKAIHKDVIKQDS
jgi:hypothetical protein